MPKAIEFYISDWLESRESLYPSLIFDLILLASIDFYEFNVLPVNLAVLEAKPIILNIQL